MSVLYRYIYVHRMPVPWEARRGCQFLITEWGELPHGCWEQPPDALHEQGKLSTTVLPLTKNYRDRCEQGLPPPWHFILGGAGMLDCE